MKHDLIIVRYVFFCAVLAVIDLVAAPYSVIDPMYLLSLPELHFLKCMPVRDIPIEIIALFAQVIFTFSTVKDSIVGVSPLNASIFAPGAATIEATPTAIHCAVAAERFF